MNKRIMNIVNFVRGCEPRKEMDLLTPVKNEIEIDHQYHIPHTFLLQYDAMLREDFQHLFQEEQKSPDTELGVWFEACRALIEGLGMQWNGRPGYDWDWYVNPGFLEAYTPTQRESIIDEVFRKFKALFGAYPRVVGSWLLDAHSMRYMSEKYEIDAFCICREQFAVDAYTLWGGYYSGGYYPSKNNMLSPAQSEELQINTPVFRMLGIDPIYGYDQNYRELPFKGCCTLEPGWKFGQDPKIVDWYLETYYKTPCLSHAQMTTGQENSFGWKMIGPGYPLQIEKLAQMRDRGEVVIEPLGTTGKAYKEAFSSTPASALVAKTDWLESGIQSYWYNSKNYRANLFLDGDKLFFRDLTKFDDRYCERYLQDVCTENDAVYDNLPLLDFRLWSRENAPSLLAIEGSVKDLQVTEENETTLAVSILFADGNTGRILLSEEGIRALGCTLSYRFGTPTDGTTAERTDEGFSYIHNGFTYRAAFHADLQQEGDLFRLLPKQDDVRIAMNLR